MPKCMQDLRSCRSNKSGGPTRVLSDLLLDSSYLPKEVPRCGLVGVGLTDTEPLRSVQLAQPDVVADWPVVLAIACTFLNFVSKSSLWLSFREANAFLAGVFEIFKFC